MKDTTKMNGPDDHAAYMAQRELIGDAMDAARDAVEVIKPAAGDDLALTHAADGDAEWMEVAALTEAGAAYLAALCPGVAAATGGAVLMLRLARNGQHEPYMLCHAILDAGLKMAVLS